jgi:hypothetical protein
MCLWDPEAMLALYGQPQLLTGKLSEPSEVSICVLKMKYSESG